MPGKGNSGSVPIRLICRGAFFLAGLLGSPVQADQQPNVLLIAIDDLNDWVGCLGGHPQAITPNIDRLAARGTLFLNAHCQAPVCNPSRASLLSGRYPHSTGIYFLSPDLREAPALQGVLTLPEAFAAAGYKTLAAGKIFHGGDQRFFQEYAGNHGAFGPLPKNKIAHPHGHPLWDWGPFPDSDDNMPDWRTAIWADEKLKQDIERPFFLAVGFYRPHVPMYVPQKWFDLHPRAGIELPPVKDDDRSDLSQYAIDLTNVNHVSPTHEWVTSAGQWDHAVQACLAAGTFVDHCVGRVLDALDASPHRDNTIIVLFSDHGFHLGEKQRWGKRTLWEDATRVPLIMVAPGFEAGAKTSQAVELLDIYPTLLQLASLKPDAGLEGQSLVPLMRDPQASWNHPAVTSFGPGNFSIRTARYRYIQYLDGSSELYDHRNDPHEWNNIANDDESRSIVSELAGLVPGKQHPLLPGNSTGHNAYREANLRAGVK